MIQRIQTVWLSILALLSISLFRGGIMQFTSGNESFYTLGFSGVTKNAGLITEVTVRSIGLPVCLVIIPVLAIAAILLFKKINIQRTVVLIVIAFTLCLFIMTGYYWYIVNHKFGGVPVPGIKMAFPPVMIVLAILAWRAIIKDEKLLKSYDRIR
jgi:hypothetical protein